MPEGSVSRLAVIISTYNQPDWLRKVLWGYACQSRNDFELVIADDGSGAPTHAVVDAARADFGARLVHVWHPDDGFRKCDILNRAILAADADYLVFSDGDCIPRRDFVEQHCRHAVPGHFLSGGVVWLPRALSERITRADVESGAIADPRWLQSHGWAGGRYRLRLLAPGRRAALLDRLTPTRATFNGHNASAWRDDLIAVNGFEGAMQYGGLDRALGERLENLGVRGRQLRHRVVAFHLDHDRPYRTAAAMRRNAELRRIIRRDRLVRARQGIAELEPLPD
ncbi:MAG TPA: glycosyltransferase family 2 protein [Longimicrobiales bacterium]|nr:glycosyltransferase family 2 protein [Longimicrobiales bacterium]